MPTTFPLGGRWREECGASFTYDEDNRVTAMTVGDVTVSYTYDGFGRLQNRTVKNGDTVIQSNAPTYSPGKESGTTTGRVNSYNGYTYTYDDNGNITYIGDGQRDNNYYQYDSQNQLVYFESEALGVIHTWTYDNAGNILSRKEYAYTTGASGTPSYVCEYEYDSGDWGDLLISYDGDTLIYDEIGNPTYDNNWSYTWQHGRQLATMNNGTTLWTFTYDANGMRTGRQCSNGYSYAYIYDGSQLVQLNISSSGEYSLSFTYDATGTPLTVSANGYLYYYVTNLQGDVIGILNSSGTQVITYTYDAWGNVTMSGTDPIGNLNPLLYRGYVYDWETGLYYLQSRYYNPQWGRFINADAFPSTGQGLLGNNMFAYCGNNPVSRKDDGGEFWNIIGGAFVGALIGVASQAISNLVDGNPIGQGLAKAAVTGAVGGALTAAFPGASTLVSVGMSAAESIITDVQNGENLPTILVNASLSAGFAAITSGDTVFRNKNIVADSIQAVGRIFPGNHPNVKNAAKEFLQETGRAVWDEIKTGVTDGLFVNYIKKATQWFSGLFTGSKSTYESFA